MEVRAEPQKGTMRSILSGYYFHNFKFAHRWSIVSDGGEVLARPIALCTLQIGFLRFPHTTETRQLGYFQIIQYLQHKKDTFGFLMYQKSLILGYFPIIKIAAVQMALIRPIRRRK